MSDLDAALPEFPLTPVHNKAGNLCDPNVRSRRPVPTAPDPAALSRLRAIRSRPPPVAPEPVLRGPRNSNFADEPGVPEPAPVNFPNEPTPETNTCALGVGAAAVVGQTSPPVYANLSGGLTWRG